MNKIILKFKRVYKLKSGSKIIKCRFGAPDGLYVDFPDYKVDTGVKAVGPTKKIFDTTKSGNIKLGLGHGMVIAVDENSGRTRGSEYGRYDFENKGIARRVSVPNFQAADPGNPTQEELDTYAEALDKSYGHSGGKTRVTYVKGADYNKMVEAMKSAESNNRENGFYVNRDYNILSHNCGTYGCDIIEKALPWYERIKLAAPSLGTPRMIEPIFLKTGTYNSKTKNK